MPNDRTLKLIRLNEEDPHNNFLDFDEDSNQFSVDDYFCEGVDRQKKSKSGFALLSIESGKAILMGHKRPHHILYEYIVKSNSERVIHEFDQSFINIKTKKQLTEFSLV
jgi:hypothetical protein